MQMLPPGFQNWVDYVELVGTPEQVSAQATAMPVRCFGCTGNNLGFTIEVYDHGQHMNPPSIGCCITLHEIDVTLQE
jgi:hypothetical protein